MRNIGTFVMSALLAVALITPVAAEQWAGPLVCVPSEELECVSHEKCRSDVIESLHLPQFIKVDFAAKEMSGTWEGQQETATIGNSQRSGGRVILQGIQQGRGWSMVIVEETGRMTFSFAGDDVAFIVFGPCTPLASLLGEVIGK